MPPCIYAYVIMIVIYNIQIYECVLLYIILKKKKNININ